MKQQSYVAAELALEAAVLISLLEPVVVTINHVTRVSQIRVATVLITVPALATVSHVVSDEAGTSDSSKVEGVRCDDDDDAECYTDDSQRQYSAVNNGGLQEARDVCSCFSSNDAQGGGCTCESDGFIGVKSVGTQNGSNVGGPCGYGMKAGMAGCCDGGNELAHSCSCGVFATRGSCHPDISDKSACEGGCGKCSCCGTTL